MMLFPLLRVGGSTHTVHVKAHTRVTDRGVELVQAHDERRHVAHPTETPAATTATPSTVEPKAPRRPTIRVGLPYSENGRLAQEAARLGAATLVSTGSLYRENRGGFQKFGDACWTTSSALDSAGFVAMLQGGYKWTVDEYVEWVMVGGDDGSRPFPFGFWSAPDYCCEAEIAGDRATVEDRIDKTIEAYGEALSAYLYWRDEEGVTGIPEPMPILQGRLATDYERCARELAAMRTRILAANAEAQGRDVEEDETGLPELVGIGSVCRREVDGPEGVRTIVATLDKILPSSVQFHLFGVKSGALEQLADLGGRVASVDSMAWDFNARKQAQERRRNDPGFKNDTEHRAACMRRWYESQVAQRDAAYPAPDPATPGPVREVVNDPRAHPARPRQLGLFVAL